MENFTWIDSKSKQTFWGLLHKPTNRIMGYTTTDNGGYASVETTYTLEHSEDNEWLVKNQYLAEYVRNYSTESYNADYNTPENSYSPDDLEVIKIEKEMIITREPVSIPDPETLIKDKFKNEKQAYLEEALKGIKERKSKNKPYKYDLYDLNNYLLKNGIISESIF